MKKSLNIVALLMVILGSAALRAEARSGQAAYHFHSSQMITAARHEPVGSVLKVTNPQNGNTVTVKVTDRGPYNGNRILDLSTGAFSKLYGGIGRGVGPVSYVVVSRGSSSNSRSGQIKRYTRGRSYRSTRRGKRSYRRGHWRR
ncbi:MAG TPA: septal ring lytic transglycosylase RlpA family protein [Abditibacteriaceae bacterium]